MSFISVLGDIHANKSKFKAWEREEADKEAKRKALYEKHPLSAQELEKKQKLADTIIDTITIMDQHSEDVSEDVESFTQPITSMSLTAALWLSGMLGIKYVWGKFNKRDESIKAIINQIPPEVLKEINGLNPTPVNYSLSKLLQDDKLQVPDNAKELVNKVRQEIQKTMKSYKKYPYITAAAVIGTTLATYVGSVLYTTKMQVGSSRIARFQAREELKDPKNFIVFTQEQVDKAKENLKLKGQEKKSFWQKSRGKDNENTGLIATFKNIKNLALDTKKYNQWKKENDKRDMRVMRELTPEEIDEAKRDKEVIHRLTRKINNKAEEYSQNMETAATVILSSSLLGGPILGGTVSWILNKIGTGEKLAGLLIGKIADKDAEKIYKQMIKHKPETQEYKELHKAFKSKLEHINDSKRGYTMFDNIKAMAREKLPQLAATPGGRTKLLAIASGLVSSVVGVFIALKLQKQAARAGRYAAKEEFRNNPQEFVAYTDEELAQVSDVKAPEVKTLQKIKEYLMFLPTAFKHHRAYMDYKKGDYKQEKALRDELVKLEVSAEQLREGKNLQRKLFNTFEKIDDKSQEYSENMEAASDIAMQFSALAGYAAIVSPLMIGGIAVASGKLSTPKFIVGAMDVFSRFSFIAKSRWFKKYLNEIPQVLEEQMEKQHHLSLGIENSKMLQSLELMKALGTGNFLKSSVSEFIQKIQKTNLKDFLPQIENYMGPAKDKKVVEKGLNALERVIKNVPATEVNSAVQKLIDIALTEPKKFTNVILNPDEIKKCLYTPILKKTLQAAGISWGVFITAVIFAVQSYFAKLQKEAGRLGVMKALEELSDDRIYADEYPKVATTSEKTSRIDVSTLPEHLRTYAGFLQ